MEFGGPRTYRSRWTSTNGRLAEDVKLGCLKKGPVVGLRMLAFTILDSCQ